MRNSFIGSPLFDGQSSGSTPLINDPILTVDPAEAEGTNDSAEGFLLLHVLVKCFAVHLTVDHLLLEDLQVCHPPASAQVIHSQ